MYVSVCMYLCMSLCMHVIVFYAYVSSLMYLCMHVHMHSLCVYAHMPVYVGMYVPACVCMHVCITCVCLFARTYVCVHTYVHVYVHIDMFVKLASRASLMHAYTWGQGWNKLLFHTMQVDIYRGLCTCLSLSMQTDMHIYIIASTYYKLP